MQHLASRESGESVPWEMETTKQLTQFFAGCQKTVIQSSLRKIVFWIRINNGAAINLWLNLLITFKTTH